MSGQLQKRTTNWHRCGDLVAWWVGLLGRAEIQCSLSRFVEMLIQMSFGNCACGAFGLKNVEGYFDLG